MYQHLIKCKTHVENMQISFCFFVVVYFFFYFFFFFVFCFFLFFLCFFFFFLFLFFFCKACIYLNMLENIQIYINMIDRLDITDAIYIAMSSATIFPY